MNFPKITIVDNSKGSGDWVGIYVDGVLYVENHSLHWADVLNALRIEYERVSLTDEEIERNRGRCPENLEDLVR